MGNNSNYGEEGGSRSEVIGNMQHGGSFKNMKGEKCQVEKIGNWNLV